MRVVATDAMGSAGRMMGMGLDVRVRKVEERRREERRWRGQLARSGELTAVVPRSLQLRVASWQASERCESHCRVVVLLQHFILSTCPSLDIGRALEFLFCRHRTGHGEPELAAEICN